MSAGIDPALHRTVLKTAPRTPKSLRLIGSERRLPCHRLRVAFGWRQMMPRKIKSVAISVGTTARMATPDGSAPGRELESIFPQAPFTSPPGEAKLIAPWFRIAGPEPFPW
jgi:hypothetical protein